jgi:hypothetical protein
MADNMTELLEYALDHLRANAYRPFVHVSPTGGRVSCYEALNPRNKGDIDLAAALRAAHADTNMLAKARELARELKATLDPQGYCYSLAEPLLDLLAAGEHSKDPT